MFYKKLKSGQPVDAEALYRTVLYLNEISSIICQFEAEFNSASQLIDFTGNQFTFKIFESDGKSVGYLYGFIELLKQSDRFSIKES